MATPRDHSAGLAGLVPASHLLLASLPGYLSAGLATARGRPRVSETWSDQPPACLASFARGLAPASHLLLASLTGYLSAGLATARGRPRISETWSNQPPACFASFARVPTSLLRISCSRPHNVGPADRPRASSVLGLSHQHSDPPVLSELPRAMEQWRPRMTSSRQAPGRQAPRRARRWTAPLSPDALPSVTVITFPEFCDPRGPSYAGSLGWGTHRPASHPPAASNDSTHRNHEHARSTCLPCLLFFIFRRWILACS